MLQNDEEVVFDRYADTHPMGGPVSDFEKGFYEKYLNGFSGNVLDIGCGDGKYIQYFHDHLQKQNSIVPCDISFKRIARVYQNGFGGVVGSGNELPFKDGSFDMVFLMQVIEHVGRPEKVIAECRRVLAATGVCFVMAPNYPIKRLYDWLDLLRNHAWSKFWDDPTHCTKLSAAQLLRVIKQSFSDVEIFPTFILGEGRLAGVRAWKTKRRSSLFFSHKLIAVCKS